MSNSKCPICNEENCVDNRILRNVECYGSNVYHFPCSHCGKMIEAHIRRVVIIHSIIISDKPLSESDF